MIGTRFKKEKPMTDIKDKLEAIFQKALIDAENLLDENMHNSGKVMKELETYIDYIDHDVIACLDTFIAEDEQEAEDDIPSQKADAWYDNFKNGD